MKRAVFHCCAADLRPYNDRLHDHQQLYLLRTISGQIDGQIEGQIDGHMVPVVFAGLSL